MKIELEINGQARTLDAPPMTRLLDALRENALLTGTKEGCGEGECGACSVLIDGQLANSCLVPVCQVEGAQVVTVEGVAADATGAKVQTAFIELNGTQCGICTPGMVLAAQKYVERVRDDGEALSREGIREALAGNLCRCTGYQKIIDAVERVANAELEAKA